MVWHAHYGSKRIQKPVPAIPNTLLLLESASKSSLD